MNIKQDNIILIGMPGCGKSTLGVLLAKLLCKSFVDADLVIQQEIGMPLQQYIDRFGTQAFIEREAQCVCALQASNTVVATGGSAPLTAPAAAHLRALGQTVFLDLPFCEIKQRLSDLATRGIAMQKGQTLQSLYDARVPIYRALADITYSPRCKDIATDALALAALLAQKK